MNEISMIGEALKEQSMKIPKLELESVGIGQASSFKLDSEIEIEISESKDYARSASNSDLKEG